MLAVFPLAAHGQANQSSSVNGPLANSDGMNASNRALQGGVSAYATTASSVPLMQGSACQSLPKQWQGVWKGSVELNQSALVKETALSDQGKPSLNEKAAQMSLKLGADDSGMQIRELTVTDVGRSSDPTPDIIFFHGGPDGHLWVLPGAHIFEHGVGGTGDVSIGGNVFIGDGVHVGKPSMGSSADQRFFNQGTSQIEYNNSGITFGGQTTFNDRYFRADQRLQVNSGTTITAGRVDLDAAKMYPNGQTIGVTGNSGAGYTIERNAALDRSSGRSAPASANSSAANQSNLPHDLLKDAHPAQSSTVMVAPGVFDQRTLSPIQAPDGTIVGYREMLARYCALGPDKMLVQISVGDPGQNASRGFSMSGYLLKQQP